MDQINMETLPDTYTLQLSNMHFCIPLGVSAEERAVGTNIEVAFIAHTTVSYKAFIEDDLTGVPNYAEIYQNMVTALRTPACLIEHVAYTIAHVILSTSVLLKDVEVTVAKINPPVGADGLKASVTLTLVRQDVPK